MKREDSAYDLKAMLSQVAVMLKASDQSKLDQKIEKLKESGALQVLAARENKERAQEYYAMIAPGNNKFLPPESWTRKNRILAYKATTDRNVARTLIQNKNNREAKANANTNTNSNSSNNPRGRGGGRGRGYSNNGRGGYNANRGGGNNSNNTNNGGYNSNNKNNHNNQSTRGNNRGRGNNRNGRGGNRGGYNSNTGRADNSVNDNARNCKFKAEDQYENNEKLALTTQHIQNTKIEDKEQKTKMLWEAQIEDLVKVRDVIDKTVKKDIPTANTIEFA